MSSSVPDDGGKGPRLPSTPVLTLVGAGLIAGGLLTADALTDPDRTAPVATTSTVASATTAPAATATPTGAPAATTTASATSVATTATTTTTTTTTGTYPSEAVYVGRDPATRISVAVAIRNGAAAAYVCDGRSLESWLKGTVTGSTITLKASADTLTVTGSSAGVLAKGTIRGRAVSIPVTLASPPAGLYRLSDDSGTTVGWIVQPDGSVVGVEKRGDAYAPAPDLTPGQPVTVDGESQTPAEVRGDDNF